MIPTAKLRWAERSYWDAGGKTMYRSRVLQQWWAVEHCRAALNLPYRD